MNQEIQQKTTENKKPRMYVSLGIVILVFLLSIGLVAASFLLEPSPSSSDGIDVNSILMLELVGFGFLIPMAVIIRFFLGAVFLGRPNKYIRTRFFNGVFVIVGLLIVGSDLFGGVGLGKHPVSMSFLLTVMAPVVIIILFFMLLIYKFQKSESELGII